MHSCLTSAARWWRKRRRTRRSPNCMRRCGPGLSRYCVGLQSITGSPPSRTHRQCGRPRCASLLEPVGLDGLLEVVVTSVDVGAAKPDPASLNEAIRRLGVTAGRSVYVGDAPGDQIAAAAAGMHFVAADRGIADAIERFTHARSGAFVGGMPSRSPARRGGRQRGPGAPGSPHKAGGIARAPGGSRRPARCDRGRVSSSAARARRRRGVRGRPRSGGGGRHPVATGGNGPDGRELCGGRRRDQRHRT